VVQGVGAAATGLGIAAARSVGDEALARRFEATAAHVESLASAIPFADAYAHLALADAIRFLGGQLRR
jgi:hypothetical protein